MLDENIVYAFQADTEIRVRVQFINIIRVKQVFTYYEFGFLSCNINCVYREAHV